MTLKEMMAELPKLTKAEKRELRRAIDRELGDAEELPPISPKTSPGPMSLDACIELGFQHQPALDAARASLGAAQTTPPVRTTMRCPRWFAGHSASAASAKASASR